MTDATETSETSSEQTQTPDAAAPAAPTADTLLTADEAQADAPAGDKPADDAKPAGAPEKYEFTAPEGVALDASLLGDFEGAARELDMPQDKAQALVEKLAPKVQERFAAQQQEVVTKARADWETQSRADKEFGGAQIKENLAHAAKALQTYGTPELRTLLNESGLGNHPEVLRFFYRAGKAMAPDTVVTGGDAPTRADPLATLYPTHFQKA